MNRVQLNILIYMGQSQYAAFNLFAKQLTEPFRRKGHNVILFDLTQEGSSQKLIELFSSTHIDLVIAFNGMGVELTSVLTVAHMAPFRGRLNGPTLGSG